MSAPTNGRPISALKSDAEEHQAETGGELIGVAADDHIGKDQVGGGAGERGCRNAEVGRARQRGRRQIRLPRRSA